MSVKKFFNADAEGETGVATEAPAAPSIASLMASKGVYNETSQQVATPIDIAPQEAEAPAEEAPSAVAASEATTQEAAAEEKATPVQSQPQAVSAAPVTEADWREVIKKQQSEAILKELGFDDRMVGFLNHWKTNGDVTAYLKEAMTDYSKMPAEEVMKHQLRLEYPKASEAQLEVLYQEEVVERYKLSDDYDEDVQERGRLLLEAKAEKYRDTLIGNQQNFLLPKPPEPQAEQANQQQLETQKMLEANKRVVVDSQFYRQVLSNNKLTLGEGDEAFNFPVDANELPEIIYDPVRFVENMFEVSQKPDGGFELKADPEKQMLVAAVAKYGKQFLIEYAKHYKAIGSKKAIDPIENPSQPNGMQPVKSEEPPKSAAEAMARHGRLSWS